MTFSGDGFPDVALRPRHLPHNTRLRGYEPRVDRHALRYLSPPLPTVAGEAEISAK